MSEQEREKERIAKKILATLSDQNVVDSCINLILTEKAKSFQDGRVSAAREIELLIPIIHLDIKDAHKKEEFLNFRGMILEKLDSSITPQAKILPVGQGLSDRDELILSLFCQGCSGGKDGKYNHLFISAYEEAQAYLINNGIIKQEECEHK